MLTDFSTPSCLNYRPPTLPSVWPLTPYCPNNFKNGKFMLPLGQLIQDEPWKVQRFHLWYMHAAQLGMKDFIVRAPKEYFHLEDDCFFTVDFHDMYRMLRCKDLDVAQVIFFAM